MEKQRKRSISVCIDWENYETLCRIAKKEYRTVSGQVFFWICQCIREYEQTQEQRPAQKLSHNEYH